MIVKGLVEEDFINYKKPSMFIAFPSCTFKCERECGIKCCQNSSTYKSKDIKIDIEYIIDRYINNHITSAIVCGGLEPFDSWDDLYMLIECIRQKTDDDIVIYTGYNKFEIEDKLNKLLIFKNIIVKLGRFIPNAKHRFDNILGVELSSDNQFAEILG